MIEETMWHLCDSVFSVRVPNTNVFGAEQHMWIHNATCGEAREHVGGFGDWVPP